MSKDVAPASSVQQEDDDDGDSAKHGPKRKKGSSFLDEILGERSRKKNKSKNKRKEGSTTFRTDMY